MLHGQTEPGRRTVVENIDSVTVKPDDIGEAVDRLGYRIEGVAATGLGTIGHIGFSEAGEIGRDDMEAIAQERDEVAEHVTRAREAMEQQKLGSADRARLTIEDIEAVDVSGAIFDDGHVDSPLLQRQGLIILVTTPGDRAPAACG